MEFIKDNWFGGLVLLALVYYLLKGRGKGIFTTKDSQGNNLYHGGCCSGNPFDDGLKKPEDKE
ncbi:hypothetical protein KCG48_11800 [Proteiniclasticum sp. BAD-10]|uniref:Uncharacterized protein n=1 Tax=Proteiniclasticum sediminis TaxID=2804028 RepID=A0A941CRX5_9CLOT|nr:hypothetical protein [Proteiniclasticum sediminis]MBR0576999.1 hypothetical protein [Proteiniclasticum sediminis]